MLSGPPAADLLVTGAKLVATGDAERRELAGGWVAITGGLVSGVGSAAEPPPAAGQTLDASGCLVTPGLVNTHHHIYQNLTRCYGPTTGGTLFEWLSGLYPLWAEMQKVPCSDEQAEVRTKEGRCYKFVQFHRIKGVELHLEELKAPDTYSPTVVAAKSHSETEEEE